MCHCGATGNLRGSAFSTCRAYARISNPGWRRRNEMAAKSETRSRKERVPKYSTAQSVLFRADCASTRRLARTSGFQQRALASSMLCRVWLHSNKLKPWRPRLALCFQWASVVPGVRGWEVAAMSREEIIAANPIAGLCSQSRPRTESSG